MTPSTIRARILRAATAMLVLAAVAPPVTVVAAPVVPATASRVDATSTPEPSRAAVVDDGLEASLETTHPVVSSIDTFTFSASARPTSGAEDLQIRFRLLYPNGRLIFQRTRIHAASVSDPARETFSRDLADIGLDPGVYRVELEVSSDSGTEIKVESSLTVYDPGMAAVPVALVLRVSDRPAADFEGRYSGDPAATAGARDSVAAVARWITSNANARATLAIPPMLLEEWRDLADGYEYTPEGGSETVESSPADAAAYAEMLNALAIAEGTGRLELTRQGYSDPDLSALVRAGLEDDIGAQYQEGAASLLAALETTASTGTVPALGHAPAATLALLGEQGVGYVVAEARPARSGDDTPATGVYRVAKGAPLLLAIDSASSATATRGDAVELIGAVAAQAVDDEREGAPVVVSADLGAGDATATALIAAADALGAQPWARLTLARDVAAAKTAGTLPAAVNSSRDSAAPVYWTDVVKARQWSRALDSALEKGHDASRFARRQSLIAESYAWAPDSRSLEYSADGAAFAHAAIRSGTDILGRVKLTIRPVTLAGTKGDVPVTIANPSELPLTIALSVAGTDEFRSLGQRRRVVRLEPKDNYFEIPVDLTNSLSGDLHVEVLAGGLVLASTDVTVHASYLDRIVTIGAVVVLLGILLAFIIRRGRATDGGRGRAEGRVRQ